MGINLGEIEEFRDLERTDEDEQEGIIVEKKEIEFLNEVENPDFLQESEAQTSPDTTTLAVGCTIAVETAAKVLIPLTYNFYAKLQGSKTKLTTTDVKAKIQMNSKEEKQMQTAFTKVIDHYAIQNTNPIGFLIFSIFMYMVVSFVTAMDIAETKAIKEENTELKKEIAELKKRKAPRQQDEESEEEETEFKPEPAKKRGRPRKQ